MSPEKQAAAEIFAAWFLAIDKFATDTKYGKLAVATMAAIEKLSAFEGFNRTGISAEESKRHLEHLTRVFGDASAIVENAAAVDRALYYRSPIFCPHGIRGSICFQFTPGRSNRRIYDYARAHAFHFPNSKRCQIAQVGIYPRLIRFYVTNIEF